MNIALIGYGKMGHAIEQAAIKRGHTITLRITSANKHEMDPAHLQQADVAIEFTTPDSAKENVLKCMTAGINVICGTTGWNEHIPDAIAKAKALDVGFLQASNFSVGVNIFFEVNKLLASLMKGREDYCVAVEETHHIAKKDAPSGTAITIAEQIIGNLDDKTKWVLNDPNDKSAVPIFSYRIEDVPGKHKVIYSSSIDNIEIIHDAHNRDGFALGAVLAAEFMMGKKGVYTMKDVLGIK
jgi:4-hydroxy-tetrahydrodipicolinate reductase